MDICSRVVQIVTIERKQTNCCVTNDCRQESQHSRLKHRKKQANYD